MSRYRVAYVLDEHEHRFGWASCKWDRVVCKFCPAIHDILFYYLHHCTCLPILLNSPCLRLSLALICSAHAIAIHASTAHSKSHTLMRATLIH